MNKELQRIKIAEFCGWADVNLSGMHTSVPWGYDPQDGRLRIVPDYLNDLNAMREAEKLLTPQQSREYDGHLLAILGFDREITIANEDGSATVDFEQMCKALRSAAAAQRAEAFLRTLNLWTDEND